MSNEIAIPSDADLRILCQPPLYMVAIAPAPLKAEPALFAKLGGVSAAFTFAPGLTWPDRRSRRLTEGYLANGVPVAYCFPNLGDALACRARLKLEMAQ